MPNTNNLKKVKDFNDEEKAAIVARANKIEAARVAKEFGTTWQVVSAIQRAAKNAANKTKVSAKKTAPAKKSNTAKTKTAPKKAARSSDERRLAILKRASEIGITQAAAEAGVSKWTVFQWRKVMKKAGYDIPKAARVHVAQTSKTSGKPAAKVTAVKAKAAAPAKAASLKLPAKTSGVYSQLELENEMLKQQVANLSAQVEKLRAALSNLA